ncbi:ATP-binding protein [Pseudoalteromonas obscura]|uniref:histidine kinase n=1 Tax=Pseudoalteromonas obscura TaxID=3048491 RepID=A0ABT7EKS7_9GAMM|nr:ATP-binding protein [Pseudoalteromonas sp. P94(2023)]MDK2595625.1 ATP-binding protein [Pseudoalteromonas sp. P94(2023)]
MTSAQYSNDTPEQKPSLAKLNYAPRIIGCVLMAIMLIGALYKGLSFTTGCFIFLNCALWPHVARLHSKLFSDKNIHEYINLHLDALFYGIWCAVVGFQVWVVFALLIVNSLNSLILGGVKRYYSCTAVLALGCISGGVWFGFEFVEQSPLVTQVVAAASVYLYCCNVGFFNRKYSGQLKRSRDKMRQQNEELREAKVKAEQASIAKSEFLANMSHEIRTPMNGILGALQIFEKGNLDKESKSLMSKAVYSAQSLLTVINDILDFSKIEAHKLALELAPFSMADTVESVVSDLKVEAEKKFISLDASFDLGKSDGRLGDSVRVRQILLNLVSNAVKFTDSGGIKIEVQAIQFQGESALHIAVKDTGIGMDKNAQQSIFDRFQQADSSTTRKYGGTGLGLAITASLVHLMGGTINLKSELGKGTTIDVILPLAPAELTDPNKEGDEDCFPNFATLKVLIAEDNEINQIVIKKMLEKTGATLDVVENGKLAVEAFNQSCYDIVLMDIQMPEMDGIEAFLLIQKANPNIPVIALTANVMSQDIAHYKSLGFAAHIGKPVAMHAMYRTIKQSVKQNTRNLEQGDDLSNNQC